jgi:hypothetical protein
VKVLANAENGPIHPGDPITSSSEPGYGMKATKAGPIIGFSMSDLTDGEGRIVVSVNHTYFTPTTQVTQGEMKSISDFGQEIVKGNDLWVSFSEEFTSKMGDNIPVVTVTPNLPGIVLCVTEITSRGFRIVGKSDNENEYSVNWIAMAKVSIK